VTVTEVRACIGKVAYPSRQEALEAAPEEAEAVGRQKRGAPKVTVIVYRCRFCHDWHTRRRVSGKRPARRRAA
jgi:hypothetical protein